VHGSFGYRQAPTVGLEPTATRLRIVVAIAEATVLSGLPMYLMSFFRIPKGVCEKLDYYSSRFFWQSDRHKKKYRLAKWSILNKPRCVGGLGILDLDVQNICLLSKWLYKLLNKNGVWQSIIKKKYLRNKTLSQVNKRKGDSHF
jgi:hypothetical protein